MLSIPDIIVTSLKAVVKVFLLAAVGFLGGFFPLNKPIFDSALIKSLSWIFLHIMLPSLSFVSICSSIKIDMLNQVWPAILWTIVIMGVSAILSFVACKVTELVMRKPLKESWSCVAFYIPLLNTFYNPTVFWLPLTQAFCEDLSSTPRLCVPKAHAIVFLYITFWMIAFWTIAVSWVEMEDPNRVRKSFKETTITTLKRVVNPCLISTVLGLCLGLWRDFQYQIFESNTFARVIGDTARTLGGPTVQVMSMILGISLALSFKTGRQRFALKYEAWSNVQKEKRLKAKAARKARKDGIEEDPETSLVDGSPLHPSEVPYDLPPIRRDESTNSLYSVYGAADAGITAKEAYGIPEGQKKNKKAVASTGVGSFALPTSTPTSARNSRLNLRRRSDSQQTGRKGLFGNSPLKHPQETSTATSPMSPADDSTAADNDDDIHLRYESSARLNTGALSTRPSSDSIVKSPSADSIGAESNLKLVDEPPPHQAVKVHFMAVFYVIFIRTVLSPLIAFLLFLGIKDSKNAFVVAIFPEDKWYRLITFLQFASPSGQTIVSVLHLLGRTVAAEGVTQLMFYQYMFSLIAITVWGSVGIWMFF
eukprot:Filipodium_phascolosomae@DN1379_c0_g1_i1.p1